jgi:hypothetical protein
LTIDLHPPDLTQASLQIGEIHFDVSLFARQRYQSRVPFLVDNLGVFVVGFGQ